MLMHVTCRFGYSNSLEWDYDLDKVELDLYRTSIDFRNGLNRNAEQWALNLRDAWANG